MSGQLGLNFDSNDMVALAISQDILEIALLQFIGDRGAGCRECARGRLAFTNMSANSCVIGNNSCKFCNFFDLRR